MATATNRLDHLVGNLRVAQADIATIANNQTWDSGLGTIVHVSITPTTATASRLLGCTVSGGTVTFKAEGGTTTASVMAWGY